MSKLKIQLPDSVAEEIRHTLLCCGNMECGGILMGEHVGHEEFRIVDVTIQMKGGTLARFIRTMTSFLAKLAEFFERTKHCYRKYNYLGEWHSHPLFALRPSQTDFHSMRGIIDDREVGANFVVLMLVRLNNDVLEHRAWSLLPGGDLVEAEIVRYTAVHDRQGT